MNIINIKIRNKYKSRLNFHFSIKAGVIIKCEINIYEKDKRKFQ